MSVRLKLASFLLLLFLVSIISSILTFRLESYGDEKLEWVIHTHNVIATSEKLLSSLKDAETGQRGFLLTQEVHYLQPYYSGISNSGDFFDELKVLTMDNPQQQDALVTIGDSMKLKLDELALTIDLAQTGRLNEALIVVRENKGKTYMELLRQELSQFTHTELLLLEQRKGDHKENRSQLVTLIKMQMAFLILLAIATAFFMKRNLFDPLNLLLTSTQKMQQGKRLDITDVVEKNEIGNLLSAFFKMNEIVHEKTEMLEYKAHHDELTGLKNRSMVNAELESAINYAQKTQTKIAVYFLDLNKFKEINDTLGHDIGDEVLERTASFLSETVRTRDHVFRLGGDEFLILGLDIAHRSGVRKLSNQLIGQFALPTNIGGSHMVISPSLGVAVYPDDSMKVEELIKFADIAMYEAKKETGSHCREFELSMLKKESDSRI